MMPGFCASGRREPRIMIRFTNRQYGGREFDRSAL
jgi:hypothetical protein